MPAYDPDAYRTIEHLGYEQVAADYDRWLAAATSQFAEPLLDLAGLTPGARVLDAACGPGVLTLRALPRIRPGGTCLGVDFSGRMIQIARTNAGGIRGVQFDEMDVEKLALPDGMFDAAVCGFGLMHFPNPSAALAELRRVLKPGGRLTLSVWAELPKVEFMKLMLDAVMAAAPGVGFPPGPPMFGLGSEAALTPLLASAGFVQPVFREAATQLTFASFDAWWNALVLGAARLGGVVRGLPEETQGRLRSGLVAATAVRTGPQGLILSGTAFLATAVRPAA